MNYRSWLAIFMAALAGSLVGVFVILPLGLIVAEMVVYPLALSIAGLLAALSATWVDRRLARDAGQARLWPTVGLTEACASLLIAASIFTASRARMTIWEPVAAPATFSSVVLAITATVAAYHCRGFVQSPQEDKRITIGLVVLAVLAVPTVVIAAALAGLAGA